MDYLTKLSFIRPKDMPQKELGISPDLIVSQKALSSEDSIVLKANTTFNQDDFYLLEQSAAKVMGLQIKLGEEDVPNIEPFDGLCRSVCKVDFIGASQ